MSRLKEPLILTFTVNTPATNLYELIYPCVTTVSFNIDFNGSKSWIDTTGNNPTTPISYTVKNEITSNTIGTIDISTGGVITFDTDPDLYLDVGVGDVISVQAPSTLYTFSKSFGISLVGER